ncbi:MAG: hypothetical protein ACK4OJ_08070 [Brevundimonas sp.]|jgi:hypothetical protein
MDHQTKADRFQIAVLEAALVARMLDTFMTQATAHYADHTAQEAAIVEALRGAVRLLTALDVIIDARPDLAARTGFADLPGRLN